MFFDEPPYYLVMDYAEGQDLRGWCEAQGGVGNIPLETRVEIVAQVADALQAAHEAGVIHRDVKPSNILISNLRSEISNGQPEVKLTDFGIGQVVSQEALAGMTRMGFTQTMLGHGSSSHTGTQLYMAPELLAGRPASIRSDIYSLGVVLYQLLIGDLGQPLTTDWAKRVSDPLLREDLERCFAGDPEERFASAGELAGSLRCLGNRQSQLVVRRAAQAAQEKGTHRRKAVRIASALVLVVGLLAGLAIYGLTQARRANTTEAKPLAVLPFAYGDKGSDYFAKQMSGELIVKLSKIGGLKVTPLTRVLTYTNIVTSFSQIGRELEVTAAVQGTASKVADRIHLTVQVNDVRSQNQLWSTQYDRDFREIFKMQSEVARGIARSLKVRLTAADEERLEERPTDNFEAYDLYLRGKFEGLTENSTNNLAAIRLLEGATQLDPNFAEALAELAHAYGVKVFYYNPEDNYAFSKGLLAAQRAVAKKPDLAAAYYAQGYLFWTHANHFDHEAAIRAYARAIRLDSALDDAHHQLGLVYIHVGLIDEAYRECDAALAVNPGNVGARFRRAGALMYGGRFEEALTAYQALRRFNPSIWAAHTALLQIYLNRTNDASRTIDEFLRRPEFKDDKGGQATAVEAILLAGAGEVGQSEEKIKLAIDRGQGFGHWHHAAHFIADAYALMNKPTEALKFLKEAAVDGYPCYPMFEFDPILKNCLKDDPEFVKFKAALKKEMQQFEALDKELFPSPAARVGIERSFLR